MGVAMRFVLALLLVPSPIHVPDTLLNAYKVVAATRG